MSLAPRAAAIPTLAVFLVGLAAGSLASAQEAGMTPGAVTGAEAGGIAGLVNDYPTEARAEYVFACMATNGQNQDILRRCSCSIDAIAAILPYDDYVSAETVLRMRQGGGERAALFRGGAPAATALMANLRRAQAEAEMICF